MGKPGSWFLLAKYFKNSYGRVSKDAGPTTWFLHSGTLVKNGLIQTLTMIFRTGQSSGIVSLIYKVIAVVCKEIN